MLTKERQEELVRVLQGLIQRRSYSGEEGEVVEFIKKTALELGYDTVHIDKYGNVICSVKGKYEGPKVLMTDTLIQFLLMKKNGLKNHLLEKLSTVNYMVEELLT